MAIIKSIPSQRIVNGFIQNTSEVVIASETNYSTQGEACLIVRAVPQAKITLNSTTTDHVVVKTLCHTTIIPDVGKIDEDYDEVVTERGACIEFRFVGGNWYILSSDGLKQS